MKKATGLLALMLTVFLLLSVLTGCDKEPVNDPQPSVTTTSADTDVPDDTTTAGSPTDTTSPEPTDTDSSTTDTDSSTTADPNAPCTAHSDADKNGLCDVCSVSVVIEIDLFGVNDLHGKFLRTESDPGIGGLSTYLKDAAKENEYTAIFSSGDMWQGSAEAGLTYGLIMTDWMSDVGFEFMTLGNHEFDWGSSYIRANREAADFPFLAINIYDTSTGARADFCEPSVLLDLGEVQLGFIGAIGDCYSSISGEMSAGFRFLVGDELTALVKSESAALRAKGADIIVYSLHDSYEGCAPELSSGGYVDIVFEGHTHSNYINKDGNGVYHLQAGSYNEAISHATVSYNHASGELLEVEAETVDSRVYGAKTDDAIVEALKTKYYSTVGTVYDSIGQNTKYRDSVELRELASLGYSLLAEERWSRYDIVLGGGFISCRSPSELPAGSVTYAMLYALFPFNNRLALCSCSGADLLNNFINSANPNYFVSYTAYGDSVKSSIDPSATYYLITDSYNYTYAPNRLTVVELYDESVFARDLLAEFVKDGKLDQGPAEVLVPGKEYSAAQLTELAAGLAANAVSEGSFYVTGEITLIENETYGNCYIKDTNGDLLYIYGMNKNGQRYGQLAEKPQVGDVVRLYGKMKHYVNNSAQSVYEMIETEIVESYSLVPIPALIELAKGLAAGTETAEMYYVKGTIDRFVNESYGNCYIRDSAGNELYVYGIWLGDTKYEAIEDKPTVGDTVILCGPMKHYRPNGGESIYEMVNTQLK